VIEGSDRTVSNAFPRSAGGFGWDDDRRPPPADRPPPPLFPDDPPIAPDRGAAPAYDDWAAPFDDDAAAQGRATPPGPYDAEHMEPEPHDGGVMHREPDEVESRVPVGQRVRRIVEAATTVVRSSVPVRTVLFLVPPLLVPPLAFDLSLGATLAVWLLLLWLVGATATVTMLVVDGADMVAMRAIGRHLERIAVARERPADAGRPAPAERPADDEALLVVGEQLDALNDRLDAFEAQGRTSRAGPIDHRPPEQWSAPRGVVDNERDDHDVADGRHWSPPRWQR
jgi:hypothetical protein